MKDKILNHDGKSYKLSNELIEHSCKGCAFFTGNKDKDEDGLDYCNRSDNGKAQFTFFEDVSCGDHDSIFVEINIIKGIKKRLIL